MKNSRTLMVDLTIIWIRKYTARTATSMMKAIYPISSGYLADHQDRFQSDI